VTFSAFKPVIQSARQVRVLAPGPFLQFIADGTGSFWLAVVFAGRILGHDLVPLDGSGFIEQHQDAFTVRDWGQEQARMRQKYGSAHLQIYADIRKL
jgi:hypothetical protein